MCSYFIYKIVGDWDENIVSSITNRGGGNASLMIMDILQNMLCDGNFNENLANSFSLVK